MRVKCAIIVKELAPNNYFSIVLNGGGKYQPVCSCSRVKSCIQRAVCIQSGYSVSNCAIIGSEISPDNYFSIALNRGGKDYTVSPCSNTKTMVNISSILCLKIGLAEDKQ